MENIIAFFTENPSSTIAECITALPSIEEKDVRKSIAAALTDGKLTVVGKRPQADAEGKPKRGRPSNLISAA